MRIVLMTLVAACGSETTPKTFNDLPTITITTGETDFDEGDVAIFRAQVGDSNHSLSDLSVIWYLDDEIACDWTSVDALGESSCEIEFVEGASAVRAQVVDPQGGAGQDSVTVAVAVSQPPVVQIISPVPSGVYRSDELIQFDAVIYDAEESASSLHSQWSSSVDGELSINTEPDSSGRIEGVSYLSEGQHQIRLDVEDSAGKRTSETVLVSVGSINQVPDCEIVQPISGASVLAGQEVIFEGLVSDVDTPATGLTVRWSSSHDGLLGESTPSSAGEVLYTSSTLSIHTHTITMEVEDDAGGLCSDISLLQVGSAPSISIVSPASGSTHNLGESISFSAQVYDTEDSSGDILVVWTSDVDGVLHNQYASSAGMSSFFASLSPGAHHIHAQVQDSSGFSNEQSLSLFINTPPEAPSISLSPALPTTTDDLMATGVGAIDVDGDPLSYRYEWLRDGFLTSNSTANLPASETLKGEVWTVRVTPNDGYADGVPSEASVNVINSPPGDPNLVVIVPATPTDGDDLVCTASGASDADGDSLSYVYSWVGDGLTWSGDTISSTDTSPGQEWVCSAYASDGSESSGVIDSSAVTIASNPVTTSCDECVDLGGGIVVGFVEVPAGGIPSGSSFLSNDFYIMTTEVSQGMFEALMSYNNASFSSCGINCPMETVSWHEAAAFANALSSFAGRSSCYSCSYTNAADPSTVTCSDSPSYNGQSIYNCPGYRLPTDLEWEYVTRSTSAYDIWTSSGGGSISSLDESSCQSGLTLSDGTALESVAWYCANAGGQPQEIAQKQANGFDVYDMHGNVFEWCQDWYDVWWSIGINPVNTSGTTKLMRGGSWDTEPYELRSAYREHNYGSYQSADVGFRLVRTGP
ncbi:MAG: SUMF1/EgtB/PvdO family nonheme iron enzyme [Myxococcota bacterium]|nr:SUMF1/EgtB/PvdO family nonheme iron enzyme [Myxococcota bacterium]